MGFPGGASGKEPGCQRRRNKDLIPGVRKIPWRSAQQPTAVFLPGEPQGQRAAGTVPGVTESETTAVSAQHGQTYRPLGRRRCDGASGEQTESPCQALIVAFHTCITAVTKAFILGDQRWEIAERSRAGLCSISSF